MSENIERNALLDLYHRLDDEIQLRYHRSIPFQDVLDDRWERARRLNFGEGATIYNSAFVFGDVKVGAHTWIGPYVILDGSGANLSIGQYCSISSGVHIYTHDSVHWALTGGLALANRGEVHVGDYCHIGAQVVIKAGVTIGDRCVVGANTFVNADVADNSIVVGSPSRCIGTVEVNGQDVKFNYF